MFTWEDFEAVEQKREADARAAGKGMGGTEARKLIRQWGIEHGLPYNLMLRVISRCENGPGGCLEWRGGSSKRGYGRIKVNGRLAATHRVAAYAAGIIDDVFGPDREQCALHSCDNPSCCNPDHLSAGTLSDNMQDCAAKGRLFIRR
jgi:hypothetical protein